MGGTALSHDYHEMFDAKMAAMMVAKQRAIFDYAFIKSLFRQSANITPAIKDFFILSGFYMDMDIIRGVVFEVRECVRISPKKIYSFDYLSLIHI